VTYPARSERALAVIVAGSTRWLRASRDDRLRQHCTADRAASCDSTAQQTTPRAATALHSRPRRELRQHRDSDSTANRTSTADRHSTADCDRDSTAPRSSPPSARARPEVSQALVHRLTRRAHESADLPRARRGRARRDFGDSTRLHQSPDHASTGGNPRGRDLLATEIGQCRNAVEACPQFGRPAVGEVW
jgi:hypothetical protein